MKIPIIVVDGGDVGLYLSKEEVEQDLEAIDVKQNTFKAFDAEGRVLTLFVEKITEKKLFGIFINIYEKVIIKESECGGSDVNGLKVILKKYINYKAGGDYMFLNSNLDYLIELAMR